MAMTLDECIWEITGSAWNFDNWYEKKKTHYDKHLMD